MGEVVKKGRGEGGGGAVTGIFSEGVCRSMQMIIYGRRIVQAGGVSKSAIDCAIKQSVPQWWYVSTEQSMDYAVEQSN